MPCVYLAARLLGTSTVNNTHGDASRFGAGTFIFLPTILQASDGPSVTNRNDRKLGCLVGGQLERLGTIDHETIVTIAIGPPADRRVRGDAGCAEHG